MERHCRAFQDGCRRCLRQGRDRHHEAHDNDGRNLARRVINSQIALAVQIRESTEPEGGRRALLRLATAPGEVSNGVYLYPACSVPSPLAASTNGEGGEHSSTLQSETPLATSPPPIEEAAEGERVYEGDYDYEYSDSYEHTGTDS